MMFFILSIPKTRDNGRPMWWLPGEHGYTDDLRKAGQFEGADVHGNPERYDNRTSTVALSANMMELGATLNMHASDMQHFIDDADATIAANQKETR